jgi:two-component system chemotaxis response regulator CheY
MPIRVLVVDDSSATRALLGGILRGLGVIVTQAGNGEEALRALATGDIPDAILLDWRMKPMDGPATLAKIRADERLNQVKVVMVTAENDAAGVRQVVQLGVSGYILKPFDKRVVAERLAAIGLGHAPDLAPHVDAALERKTP